jgi:pSer/pThr/pTyr-binding forkhead associated (FHA) protein
LQVEVTQRGVFVTDLQSSNGTSINGRDVAARATVLRVGDQLTLADQVRT